MRLRAIFSPGRQQAVWGGGGGGGSCGEDLFQHGGGGETNLTQKVGEQNDTFGGGGNWSGGSRCPPFYNLSPWGLA